MKGEGYYVARGLSFKEAEFQELECKLTAEQRVIYDDAAQVRPAACCTQHWAEVYPRLCHRLTLRDMMVKGSVMTPIYHVTVCAPSGNSIFFLLHPTRLNFPRMYIVFFPSCHLHCNFKI